MPTEGTVPPGAAKSGSQVSGVQARVPSVPVRPLGQWLRRPDVKSAIILNEPTNGAAVAQVISQGYASDLDDVELLGLTRDPFLIAAALLGPGWVVATREVLKRRRVRANRKVPDVCVTLGIECINDFELWRRLDFRNA